MVNHDPKRGFGPFDFNLVSVDFQSHQGAIFPQLFPRKFSPCSCFLDAFFPHKKTQQFSAGLAEKAERGGICGMIEQYPVDPGEIAVFGMNNVTYT